jgi:gamma-glutamyltranspeptidase/glutathione hydrolase
MAALEMLNILERFSPATAGPLSVEELHKKIEAMKLSYADLARYNADPRFAKVPVAGLLSKEYAKERAQLIDPGKANCDTGAGRPPASDTTYLTAVDREGNIVSLIQSNFSSFGSGITVRGMGFLLQNRGALFMLDSGKPDAPVTSVHSTRSFQPLWSAATTTSGLALWVAPTNRWRTPSSCRMWSTTA